jgi:hypothetical protein
MVHFASAGGWGGEISNKLIYYKRYFMAEWKGVFIRKGVGRGDYTWSCKINSWH